MREIKFRFFSNPDEKMYALTLLGLNWELESDPSVYEGKNVWDGREGTRVQRYSDGHLMQFTGLKDKNGKEIYEGDICLDNSGNLMVVVYENGCFYIKYQRTVIGMGYLFRETSCIEVIGNEFNNPELLEGGTLNNENKTI